MPTLVAVESTLAELEAELARRTKPLQLLESLPPKLQPLLRPARYKAVHGGRGSAKSHSLGRLLLARCVQNPGTRFLCVREIQQSLKDSVKKLLENLIDEYELDGFTCRVSEIETPGGGLIAFVGMQNHTADSIKSIEGMHGAWFEEAQTCSQRSLDLLRPTIRMPGSEIWFSWNPDTSKDPVEKFFRGEHGAPEGSIVVEMNFRNNPYFPRELQDEAERDQRRDPDKYAHIWLGQYQKVKGARVFTNWRVEEFDTPSDAAFLFGADWGFSVDPTVLVRGFVRGKTLYIDAEAYQVGCEIDNTPALFDTLGATSARAWEIVADSARPETISYMQRHGYPRIVAARKGTGSVEEGINFLKTYDIVVHPRCEHTIDELSTYSYKKHPLTDEIMPVLEDKKNHVIDALRYSVEKLHKGKEWVNW